MNTFLKKDNYSNVKKRNHCGGQKQIIKMTVFDCLCFFYVRRVPKIQLPDSNTGSLLGKYEWAHCDNLLLTFSSTTVVQN